MLIYLLQADIVHDGRKGAERTNSKVQEAFRQSSGFKMRIDFRDAFPADLLLRHLQHTGTIAGFGLIAMDDKIFVYLGTVIMEGVLCSV